jgi:biotin carboxylase
VWRHAGVPCPNSRTVSSSHEAVEALRTIGPPCVIKPASGSGSEFVFSCGSADKIRHASQTLIASLSAKADHPMYAAAADHFLVEEMISGLEYSCDALLTNGEVRLIRLARKIPKLDGPFGCALAYEVPACLPENVSIDHVTTVLARAARALKLTDTIFMADFIFSPKGMVMLELSPRPGGDCLPDTIRHSSGLDMLGLALDFAEGRDCHVPPSDRWQRTAGLRIFASQSGRLQRLDTAPACDDQRVCGVYRKHRPGHQIVLPPDDYDSWILGHIIFTPQQNGDIVDQCMSILDNVNIVITGNADD